MHIVLKHMEIWHDGIEVSAQLNMHTTIASAGQLQGDMHTHIKGIMQVEWQEVFHAVLLIPLNAYIHIAIIILHTLHQ